MTLLERLTILFVVVLGVVYLNALGYGWEFIDFWQASLLVGIYFFPSIVARFRRHRNTMAIFVLNLTLGWVVIGWIVGLIWACTNNVERRDLDLGAYPRLSRREPPLIGVVFLMLPLLAACGFVETSVGRAYGDIHVEPHPAYADSVRIRTRIPTLGPDPLYRTQGPAVLVVEVLGERCRNAPTVEEGRTVGALNRTDITYRVICPAARG